MDMYKTLQIVRALEENGYRQNGDKNVSWSFVENKAISLIDNTYRYPTVVYDYVTKLNEKCNNYIYMRANCGCECEKLNRKPATKTGNMIYQIIELERVNKK